MDAGGAMSSMLRVFLDTNTLLHYRPIQEIDWLKFCGADAVELVLCMQVIGELDDKKRDPRLRDRAQRAIKEIDSIRHEGGHVRRGVTLSILNRTLRDSDFPADLSPDSQDDRIIFFAQKYAELYPADAVAICSEDYGMSIRGDAAGVRVIKPDSEGRLESPASEQDRQLKQLKQELAALKSAMPRLHLALASFDAEGETDAPPDFVVGPTPPLLDVEVAMKKYREEKDRELNPSMVIDGDRW